MNGSRSPITKGMAGFQPASRSILVRRFSKWGSLFLACLLLLSLAGFAHSEDKKSQLTPVIIAIAPLELTPGVNTTLHVRGLQLDTATDVRFSGTLTTFAAQIKEKKKADLPNGLEAKEIGDTQIEVALTVPAELPVGSVHFKVVTPEGETSEHEIRVLNASDILEEKEPNDGLRTAQPLEAGKILRGSIKADKDVDVFKITGQAKQCLRIAVHAATLGSLLDGVLTLLDSRGNILAVCDDANGSRDPELNFTPPADGSYYVCLQDAHDRGGLWHVYELEVK